MRQKSGPQVQSAEQVVRDIRRATRKHHAAEDKSGLCWKDFVTIQLTGITSNA